MTTPLNTSNVYYLAPPAPRVSAVARTSRWTLLRVALGSAWWRLRLSVAEIRAALRAPRPGVVVGERALLLDDAPREPRRGRSAPVIDFVLAAHRLRPPHA